MERPWIPIRRFEGHAGAVYDAVWHPGAAAFLTAGGDGTVARWLLDSPDGLAVLHHSRAFFSVTPWGDGLIAGTEDGELFHRADLGAGSARRITAHGGGVFTAVPSGADLYTGGGDGAVRHWTVAQDGTWSPAGEVVLPHAAKVRTLARRPGALLAATSGGAVWEFPWTGSVPDFRSPRRLTEHPGGCHAAVWHPGKRVWITGGKDGQLRVTSPDGTQVLAFAAHAGTVYRLVLEQGVLVSAGRDKAVKAWDAQTLAPLARTAPATGGPTRSVNALAASPHGVVCGGDDRIGRLLPWPL